MAPPWFKAAASTQTFTIVDSYEDGDINEYSGDTGSFSVSSPNSPSAVEGSNVLESTASGQINSASGLDNYLSKGDSPAEIHIYLTSGSNDVEIFYGLENESSSFPADVYRIRLDAGNGNLLLIERSGGSNNQLDADTSVSFPTGEWLRLKIEWQSDDSHAVTLYDSNDNQVGNQLTATSTANSGSGVGYRESSGNTAYYDYYHYESSGSGGWSSLSTMPTGVEASAVAYDDTNDVAYVCGGMTGYPDNPTAESTVQAYDVPADSWSTKTSMSTARRYAQAFFDGTYVYVLGGQDGDGNNTLSIERHDPSADSWSTLSETCPDIVSRSSIFYDGTYAYIVGMIDPNDSSSRKAVYRYDPSAGSFTRMADMPTSRSDLTTAWDGSYAYAIGGRDSDNNRLAAVEQYDPSADSWDGTVSDMPTNRSHLTSFYDGTYVYAVGGWDGSSSFGTVERYDPSTDSWEAVSTLPSERRNANVWYGPSNGYAAGGYESSSQTEADTTFRYD